MLQFNRLANIYFLIIAILQTIPAISPLSPLTAWAPLIFVIALSLIREGFEDYNRYRSDKMLNEESRTKVFREGKAVEVTWAEVVVGEICLVEESEMIPADLILIASSIEGGIAYIETASLDGEKNLKPRMALKDTSHFSDIKRIKQLQGVCSCEAPSKELHEFQGSITLQGSSKKLVVEGDKQLLYRGAKLKNTKWIYGLVIYTGRNSKIMMNSESSANKMSQIEFKVNQMLVFIFLFQCVLCFVCAVGYGITQNNLGSHWYLEKDSSVIGSSVLIFLSYLVLFNTMIPISLIVSLEIVKSIQGYFITKDNLLYNTARERGATVFSSSLNEQLGQIEYVFTDKTGTLTCNKMEFKIAVIGEQMFGDRSIIGQTPDNDVEEYKSHTVVNNIKGYYDDELNRLLKEPNPKIKLNKPLAIKTSDGRTVMSLENYKQLAEEYMLLLATTHECVVEEDKNKQLVYQGPSPDEITLVDAAKNMGYVFMKSDNQYSYVQIKGKQERFDLLSVHSFNSDRKRMTVIIRHNGLIKMYVKGADSIIKKRLAPDQPYLNTIDNYLNTFAVKGLRTLLTGVKVLTEAEYAAFREAEAKLPEEGRGKLRDNLVSELEKGFSLIGATAVLDRLQDNVPQTIRDLLRANVKVWMLTGDKMETAENIAMSCNLIQPSFKVLKFLPKTHDMENEIRQLSEQASMLRDARTTKALLIEGEHLGLLLESETCRIILAQMAEHCEAVVCCRLMPAQKASVVRLVKVYLGKITLSIGDGNNDVPMINEAHIGVGLYGEEGMGAVQASDYALPEFQGLWRLLLVHGRWNYIRVAEMILYFFYKNMVFTIPQFYFAFYCGFTAQSFFDDTYISLYNIVFTAIPLITRAILEQDVYFIYQSDKIVEKPLKPLPENFEEKKALRQLYPKIYFVGQQNTIFNNVNFLLWIAEAIVEALLITLICIYVLSSVAINATGINSDLWIVSVTAFSSVIMVVSFKIATHTKFWNWLMFISLFLLSICLYICYMWISNVLSGPLKGTIIPVYTTLETWLTVFFCIAVILIIDGLLVYYDFLKGGYSSKMRQVVCEEKIDNKGYYQEIELKISENLTQKKD